MPPYDAEEVLSDVILAKGGGARSPGPQKEPSFDRSWWDKLFGFGGPPPEVGSKWHKDVPTPRQQYQEDLARGGLFGSEEEWFRGEAKSAGVWMIIVSVGLLGLYAMLK